jgi:hypothetical protein
MLTFWDSSQTTNGHPQPIMPAQQSIVSQILAQAAQDIRAQPWKAEIKKAEIKRAEGKDAAQKDDEEEEHEIVKTGGPLDVLTNYFNA